MNPKTRPDTASAMATFLARGGVVKVTPPATADVQREIARARYRADRDHERAILSTARHGDGSPVVEETEEAQHIRRMRDTVDGTIDFLTRGADVPFG
jgi:hypothetical protein